MPAFSDPVLNAGSDHYFMSERIASMLENKPSMLSRPPPALRSRRCRKMHAGCSKRLTLVLAPFQPETHSSEHPALGTQGQAYPRALSSLCPPGQPFKIKHIVSYWAALPIAPADSSPYNLSHPERVCFFQVHCSKTFSC